MLKQKKRASSRKDVIKAYKAVGGRVSLGIKCRLRCSHH
jgi:hypothetical protein